MKIKCIKSFTNKKTNFTIVEGQEYKFEFDDDGDIQLREKMEYQQFLFDDSPWLILYTESAIPKAKEYFDNEDLLFHRIRRK